MRGVTGTECEGDGEGQTDKGVLGRGGLGLLLLLQVGAPAALERSFAHLLHRVGNENTDELVKVLWVHLQNKTGYSFCCCLFSGSAIRSQCLSSVLALCFFLFFSFVCWISFDCFKLCE